MSLMVFVGLTVLSDNEAKLSVVQLPETSSFRGKYDFVCFHHSIMHDKKVSPLSISDLISSPDQ